VVEGYGLSECTVVCTANPVHGVRKAGSVGLALPGVEVGVVDSAGQLLPAGQAGEVVVRGPNVMRGYLGRPVESAEVLRGGWLHTGDVGRFDDDGYLTLVDRVKDLIIRGGENIYPKEIEDVLYAHPAVLEAAVVGRPDAVFGEQPVAFVALRPGRSVVPANLIEHCLGFLARYKVPREVYIEKVLPKNPVGKIAKPMLRERLRAERLRAGIFADRFRGRRVKVDVDVFEALSALGFSLTRVRAPVAGRQGDVVGERGKQRPGMQADDAHDVDLHAEQDDRGRDVEEREPMRQGGDDRRHGNFDRRR
jgi:hypothetical protein